jgi:NAD+ kinase
MNVAVYGKQFSADFSPYIIELFDQLSGYGTKVQVYEPFLKFLQDEINCHPQHVYTYSNARELDEKTDFMFSVGGDGTFLEAVPLIKIHNVPLIGLNSGRLGFLANIAKNDISRAVQSIFKGEYKINPRTLLEVETHPQNLEFFNCALNDITIQKTDNTLINVKMFINDEFVTTYWTDGVIIATPTGSTAYSLSVGGPIVSPNTNNFIISPIASHNLSVRPLVVSDDVNIELEVTSRNKQFIITVDNRNKILESGTRIKLAKSDFCVSLLDFKENTYFKTLRSKLMWGADKRN